MGLSGKNSMQLHHYFENSVNNFPTNTALVCDNVVLTYRELDHKANQLAHCLQQHQIKPGSIVGILLERSLECYVAILAVLKAGAAYVPIESEYPDERINHIFNDLPFDLVITSSQQAQKNLLWPKQFILDGMAESLAALPTERVHIGEANDSQNKLCYVIYTSGSTGKPKGVEIPHASICHYVQVASEIYEMTSNDKIYQGFSLAFDASLEEVWMAFANGAALIACTEKETRSGVGLLSFLKQHHVTVFSTVPTLLATLEGELGALRLLILGGETCQASLVKQWSRPGLKIMNTYGPTEATVIATYAACEVEREITIGQPLPGYTVVILNEQLQEVKDSEAGELCIGGLALARGYVNRPESTAEKFIMNPADKTQRLYRTGDLAFKDKDGNIHFAGRVDDQVKLRGFRIELNEIETVVMNYPGIKQAVVALQTLDQPLLVAYLILDKHHEFNEDGFKTSMRAQLPDYMMPAIIETLDVFPLLPSGKVNRKALPKPTKTEYKRAYKAPTTEFEKEIKGVWERDLKFNKISVDADFFYDLGGHSLHAAQIISSLRKIPAFKNISILDLYKNPTIEQLAKKFSSSDAQEQSVQENPVRTKYQPSRLKYYTCGLAQLFGILFQYAVGSWQLIAVYVFYSWNSNEFSLISREWQIGLLSMFLLLPLITLAIPVLLKWVLLGRIKPGEYRLWGWFYFRWWLVQRLIINAFSYKTLTGTPLINIYYRLLGAKIGKDSYIGAKDVFTYDLIRIGEKSSIGAETKLSGYVVEDGWLKIGSVTIGDNCYIGPRSVLGINTQIEDNAILDDMSMLPDNSLIPQGGYYAGSPAEPAILSSEHIAKKKMKMEQPSQLEISSFGIMYYLGVVFLMLINILSFLPGLSLVDYFYTNSSYAVTIFLATPLAAVICLTMHYLSIIVCKKIVLNKLKPGLYPLYSFCYFRYWLILELMDNEHVSIMSDSLYLPMFLRAMGAQLGRRVEMGEAPRITPDMVTIKDGGFTASSVALAWPKISSGMVYFAPVTIGEKAFAGNVSYLEVGKSIGNGGLLGCLSIAPNDNKSAEANTSWLGSPSLFLPKRELFAGYTEEETYSPSAKFYCIRLLIEFIRITIPTAFSLIILFNLIYVMDFMVTKYSFFTIVLTLPVAELFTIAALIGSLSIVKWTIQGKLKPTAKPLWDIFIWKNDFIEFTYNYFMCPYFVDMALGSPFVLLVAKCLGSKVGKRVYCETNAIAEFDLIDIGDDVCINHHTLIQTHLYEDRIFKVSQLTIRAGCNVGINSIILYDTLMEENSSLGNLSLLMKGERLPANTRWAGIPAQSTLVTGTSHVAPQLATQTETLSAGVPELL